MFLDQGNFVKHDNDNFTSKFKVEGEKRHETVMEKSKQIQNNSKKNKIL